MSPSAVDSSIREAKIQKFKNGAQPRLEAAISRFEQRNPQSKALHEHAVRSLPGGNTRTILHTAPFPISMKSGQGFELYDEDEHKYVK